MKCRELYNEPEHDHDENFNGIADLAHLSFSFTVEFHAPASELSGSIPIRSPNAPILSHSALKDIFVYAFEAMSCTSG